MEAPQKPVKPKKKKQNEEQQIQKQIMDFLKLKGFYAFKNHQGFGSEPGVADIYAIKKGINFWIEVKKSKGGRQSEWQKYFQDTINYHEGHYILATCLDDVASVCRDMNL